MRIKALAVAQGIGGKRGPSRSFASEGPRFPDPALRSDLDVADFRAAEARVVVAGDREAVADARWEVRGRGADRYPRRSVGRDIAGHGVALAPQFDPRRRRSTSAR